MRTILKIDHEEVEINMLETNGETVTFVLMGKKYLFRKQFFAPSGDQVIFTDQANNRHECLFVDEQFVVDGLEGRVAPLKRERVKKEEDHAHQMISPMPGKILKILKKQNESVKKGEVILIMEAMKMEHSIKAISDGIIQEICYKEGDQVAAATQLVVLC